MKIKLTKDEKKILKMISDGYKISREQLISTYASVMESNFYEDIKDIAKENYLEEK